jgi:cytochrome c biogenesis protein CcdA/thiol-disulfide isomerase/thioredoxin
MLLLTLFALLAGAGTALSPCVLPVLPALLSAGATGGRRRPLGVVTGLAVTFTVTIVGLASVADGVGLGTDLTRDIAVVALLGFGAAVLVPAIGDRMEARLSGLSRLGPRRLGDGFGSGLAVGAALGFVYAPCAGPILAGVIAVSAASGRTVVVGAAYAAGSAAVLLVLALGGRRVFDRIRSGGHALTVQRALGGIMIATALAMLLQLDVRFQTAIADHLPAAVVNPTKPLEESAAVRDRLADLNGRSRFEVAAAKAEAARPAGAGRPSRLPKLGAAPEFTGTQRWFNTPGDRPLTLAGLRAQGRVVLIDFWTYTCINCIRTLPYLRAWDARYRKAGLTIVGVHSPEFAFEKQAGNVQDAIRRSGLRYPVVQDNDLATWGAWQNQYWPAEYLIDRQGQVRRVHFGEGEYDEQEAAIRSLLAERPGVRLGAGARPRGVVTPSADTSPETYLGSARAQGWVPAPPANGTHRFTTPTGAMELSTFALGGVWRISDESAEAVSGARLDAQVQAKDVYLVLSSRGGAPRKVRVRFGGKDFPTVSVRRQRLYTLVSLPRPAAGHLTLRLDPGVSGYAFTFG